MGEFQDISDYFSKLHPVKCLCMKSVRDFQSFDPMEIELKCSDIKSCLNILLLGDISRECEKLTDCVKAHFMLLATKYHLDKNKSEVSDKCTLAMAKINSAYHGVMGSLDRNIQNGEVIEEGDLISLIDNQNISALHVTSHTLYSQPALVNEWVRVIGDDLVSEPSVLRSKKGVQLGIEDKSVIVNVYDNGTILSSGTMGMYYGIAMIERQLLSKVKMNTSQIECPTRNRSTKFKQYIKYFNNVKTSTKQLVTEGQSNMEHSQKSSNSYNSISTMTEESTKPETSACKSCQDEIKDLRNQLANALQMIGQLQEQMSVVTREQNKIQSTFGSQIAGVAKRVQEIKDQSHKAENSSVPNRGWEKPPGNGAQSNPHKSKENKIKVSSPPVSFQPERCVVIHDMKIHVSKDQELRKLVSQTYKGAVIERIVRSGERSPKYIIQLTKPEMVDEVIKKWDPNNLGSSCIRRISNERKQGRTVGFAKHVPKEIEEEELKTILSKKYPGSSCKRLHRNSKPLETVKVFFADATQLEAACSEGLWLEEYYFHVPVHAERPKVVYTQCFHCWRFGHIAKRCQSAETCKCCSENHNHEECPNDTKKCRNCGLAHHADDWDSCKVFSKYKEKCVTRFNRRNGED